MYYLYFSCNLPISLTQLRLFRFTVTHLLIPKQTGKSDRCDLEGHEDLGEAYDR